MKRIPTGMPFVLPFLLLFGMNAIVHADANKFCDEWSIIGLGSVYRTSMRLRITESDIAWPGCESTPYDMISMKDDSAKLLVPKLNCNGIEEDSGGGYVMVLTLQHEDELRIRVYDAQGKVEKDSELAWGVFRRLKRMFSGRIGDHPISMRFEVRGREWL